MPTLLMNKGLDLFLRNKGIWLNTYFDYRVMGDTTPVMPDPKYVGT